MEDIVKQDLINAFSGTTSIEEQTKSTDSGAYVTPQVWAKNNDNWRALKDPDFPMYGGPGGTFVKVKSKCSVFPYCNQGDINALDFYQKPKKKKKRKKNKLTPLGRRKRKIAKDLVKNQRIKTPRGKHYNIGRRISEDTGYLYYNNELTQEEVNKAILENTMKNKTNYRSLGKSIEEQVRKNLIKEQTHCGVCGDVGGTGAVTEDDATILLSYTELELDGIMSAGEVSTPIDCPGNIPFEGASGILSYLSGDLPQLTCEETLESTSSSLDIFHPEEDGFTQGGYKDEKDKLNALGRNRAQSHGYGCDCGDGNYDKTCCGNLQEAETHQAQKLYAKVDKENEKTNQEGLKLAAEKIKKFMSDDKGDTIEPPMYRNTNNQDEFVEDIYYSSGQTGIEYDQPLTDKQKKRHEDYLKGSIETGNNTGKGVDGQQVANITTTNAEGGANTAGGMLAKAAKRRSKNLAKGNEMANNDRRYSPDVQATTTAKKINEDIVTVSEHMINTPEQILNLTPPVYKIDGREWSITNGKETKKVRYESFIGRSGGMVIILEETNHGALTEEISRIKNMFNHDTNTRHNNFL